MSILPIHSPAVPHHYPDVAKIRPIADQLAWRDDDEANDPADGYPGPSWDHPRYEPTPEAAAQDAGFTLGYGLAYAALPPADMDDACKALWVAGKAEGIERRHRDDADREAFHREMTEWAARRDVRDPSEVIRAVGCIAARLPWGQP